MKVMAQIAMVMNLDKCIGCHTCSVTCKRAWMNREGTEYMQLNNVETRPGVGYPRRWSDQNKWKGGWRRTKAGKLVLEQGGRLATLAEIFHNPAMPTQDDYYEPWTYECDKLLRTPTNQKSVPSVPPVSQIAGEEMGTVTWDPSWDDNLSESVEALDSDPVLKQMNLQVSKTIEDTYMFYLPRICEHCLNPAYVSTCPSGAIYKRTEDGIVLVGQDKCRGWRMCVSAYPYRKVYFNHKTGKAKECTLCYPRLEAGLPMACSEACVGRLRCLGVLLYDADRVSKVAATRNEGDLYEAQRSILLDPFNPEVIEAAKTNGVPHSQIKAAQQSPAYTLIHTYTLTLPLRPEFRALPMVWYVPPLSPVVDRVTVSDSDGEGHKILFSAITKMRIPLKYLTGLFAAGNTKLIELVLHQLGAMRSYMHDIHNGREGNEQIAAAVGMTGVQLQEAYWMLAIAKYDDRYVMPTISPELPRRIAGLEGYPVSYNVEAFHEMSAPKGDFTPEGRTMLLLEVLR